MKLENVGANPLSRFIILFTLALLVMGLFVTPAVAEPAFDCTPATEDLYGWANGVQYQCKCVFWSWTEKVCSWVKTGATLPAGYQSLTYFQPGGCNLTTANLGKNGTAIVASAIATSGYNSGTTCRQVYDAQRARMVLQRWNGGFYATCTDTGYIYGSTYAGLIVNRVYSSAPCGSGSYRVLGGAWTLVNGVYQGGYVATGALAG